MGAHRVSRKLVSGAFNPNQNFLSFVEIIERELPLVCAGNQIEPLHQLRVTLRRLRNGFWIYKHELPRRSLVLWKKGIREASKPCGQCRDLDVQIQYLENMMKGVSVKEAEEFKVLINRLQQKRLRKHRAMHTALVKFRRGNVLKSLKRFFMSPQGLSLDTRRNFTQGQVSTRYQKLYLSATPFPEEGDVVGLHQMRIQAKRLRYTLEFFKRLDRQITGKTIQRVIDLQRVLGQIHDFDVWQAEWTNPPRQLLSECRQARQQGYLRLRTLWKGFISDTGQQLRA